MASSATATHPQRRFQRTAFGIAALATLFVILLIPIFPLSLREQVSGVGLLVGGLVAGVATLRRARLTTGAASRPWRLLAAAAVVAIAGNLWVTATGSDPTTDPSLVSIASIAIAVLLSIVAVLSFPVARRRGAELVVTLLDGLVAGGAFLLIASVTAFSSLLDSTTSTTTADQVTGVAFPVLDVLLATVAVLLVVRADPADRLMLVLVAGAFLLYAASDLAYAVRTNQGDFYFGTVLDLGWILGYLLVAIAAVTPIRVDLHDEGASRPASPTRSAPPWSSRCWSSPRSCRSCPAAAAACSRPSRPSGWSSWSQRGSARSCSPPTTMPCAGGWSSASRSRRPT